MGDDFRGTYTYLLSIRKPVIAAVNGPVAGMAVPIVACCDLRFASPEASFMTAFSKRGLIAEWGSSWILPRLLGPAHALDLLFSARKVDAAEAERIGLVNRSRPRGAAAYAASSCGVAANRSPTSMMTMSGRSSAPDRQPRPAEKAVWVDARYFKRDREVVSFLEKCRRVFPRENRRLSRSEAARWKNLRLPEESD
jgi:enoyl-CoA hydratase/carnithine racemase